MIKGINKILILFLFLTSFTAISGVYSFSCGHDDELLSQLINKACENNTPVELEENRVYRITKKIDFKTSINGNNAAIIPSIKSTVAVNFSGNGIFVNDLKIKGNGYKMLDVTGNNITFDNCEFETKKYFVLLRISGNDCTIKNSSLRNFYKKRKQFVVKSKKGISIKSLIVKNSKINGGFHLVNEKLLEIGNYLFEGNDIIVDYSHADQNMIKQNDGFHFAGIKGLKFLDNNIKFVNVTRGFKMTDYKSQKGKTVSKNPTTDVLIKNNKIQSNSKNGKQLFDFFDGTGVVNIVENEIRSKGHTTLFEDKTTYSLNILRCLNIYKNKIYFDFRILYYRGAKESGLLKNDVLLNVIDNDFYFIQIKKKTSIKRAGSEKEIKLQFPIYARSINNFVFSRNSFYSVNQVKPFKSIRLIYIYDVIESNVIENSINGGVLYAPIKNGVFKYELNNISDVDFKELILLRPVTKGGSVELNHRLFINNNNINHTKKNFKLSSGTTTSSISNKLKKVN